MSPADNPRPLLIIPAAGTGSRIKADVPKFALPVHGRPMLEWLIELYAEHVSGLVIVVSSGGVKFAERYVTGSALPTTLEVQVTPTGMLDAVMLAGERVRQSAVSHVWITWCDQIAIRPETVATLERRASEHPQALVVMPTVRRAQPYIHFDRDAAGQIVRVRQRREGDAMPAVGEGDAGLFSLSRRAFLGDLPDYAAAVAAGTATGERNLLPFIPWAASRGSVLTFPCLDEMESVGINTREELALVESHLAQRAGA